MLSGSWTWWIEENTPKKPALNLGFTTTTDKYGNVWHLPHDYLRGKDVKPEPRRKEVRYYAGIDHFDKDAQYSKSGKKWVPVPEEIPKSTRYYDSFNQWGPKKKPKSLTFFQKILITLGILTIKKQNEK